MSKTQFPIRIEQSSKVILVAYAESIGQKYTESTAQLVEKLAFALDKKEEPVFVELTDKLVLLSSQEYLIMLTALENAAKWEKLQESQKAQQPAEQAEQPETKPIGFILKEEKQQEEQPQEEQPEEKPTQHNIGKVGMI